ncbi:MAG: Gmad2 immunoglobulin-like domain-containing protein [Nitriliruptorales bacterium]|nr:Gmad2 immunoglobulin-like domain-containing protein [Nitriliruptorales bacterium]
MNGRTAIGIVVLAMAATGCGTEPSAEISAPTETETETVAEAVTAAAEEPTPTPTETATVTEEAAPSPVEEASVCDEVKGAGGESLAFVFVEQPVPGTEVTSGFEVTGCANAFEATYEWELLDKEGAELAAGFGTASCGTGCVGDLSFTVEYTAAEMQVGSLRVFTRSARDGSVQDLNAIPLRLAP